MTISSLSGPSSATPLTSPSNQTSSASPANSSSIGTQLLAAWEQSEAASGASTDPMLQELVSLSPAAQGQTTAAPAQTYNAQGLLQQMQNNVMLNDPLLQTDTSGTDNNSLMQSLTSLLQTPALSANTAGSSSAASAAAVTAPATTTGSTDPNANLVQLLQQNPALASVVEQSQLNQGLLSMMGP